MSKTCGVCGKQIDSGIVVEPPCLEELKQASAKLKAFLQEIEDGTLVHVVNCVDCKYTSWCVKTARTKGYCSEGVNKS